MPACTRSMYGVGNTYHSNSCLLLASFQDVSEYARNHETAARFSVTADAITRSSRQPSLFVNRGGTLSMHDNIIGHDLHYVTVSKRT